MQQWRPANHTTGHVPIGAIPPVVPMTAHGHDGLLVALSDLHIGGDAGQEDFFCHEEYIALLDDLDGTQEPVTLLINGDFFEFLQVSVPHGVNRVQVIVESSLHAPLFERLREWNAQPHHRTVYIVGNHDGETGWNPAIGAYLIEQGIVHVIALGYEHTFTTPEGETRTLYAEHGNEEDAQNAIVDYGHPLVAPLGTFIVTQFVNRVEPLGRFAGPDDATTLSDIDNIHPLEMVPWWLLSNYFYRQVRRLAAYVLIPAALILTTARFLNDLILWLTFGRVDELSLYNLLRIVGFLLLDVSVVLGLVVLVLWRDFARWRRRSGIDEPVKIAVASQEHYHASCRAFLNGVRRPSHREHDTPMDVFLFGHNHIAELRDFPVRGRRTAFGNTGTWMRKIVRVPTHGKLPPVFVPVYDLTYITARMTPAGLRLSLERRVKPLPYRLRFAERFASAGRRPALPPASLRGKAQTITRVTIPDTPTPTGATVDTDASTHAKYARA